ncbi:MAG: DUF1365 domain-containing protein [Pseudomonadota bacterium]
MLPDQYGVGQVWHRRTCEHEHFFRYQLWYCLLDVDRIDARLRKSWLWGLRPWSLIRFRRQDYMRPKNLPLGEAVRDRVETVLNRRPAGQIRLLSQLRQWGLCFNPVSFYFCYDAEDRLDSVVGEVHNTPWGERHAYVMDATGFGAQPEEWTFQFDKAFHVSPFLPMDMRYEWRFKLNRDLLRIHMLVTESGAESLRTGLNLSLHPLDQSAMRWLPFRTPLQAVKVVGGIYWQAFRLWCKRTRFYSHPERQPD